jgi:predicted solute-binding protein
MNLDNAFENTNVWGDTIAVLKEKIKDYNECTDEAHKKEMFEEIVDNIPSGLLLPASITTNYLQLKTMYFQRRHHKLQQWRDFCDYVENLPMFRELVLNKQ